MEVETKQPIVYSPNRRTFLTMDLSRNCASSALATAHHSSPRLSQHCVPQIKMWLSSLSDGGSFQRRMHELSCCASREWAPRLPTVSC